MDKRRCAQTALPPAAPHSTDSGSSSSSLHACYTYVQSVTNTSQMTLSGTRVCGAAECSTAVAQRSTAGSACEFSMLVRDLPRHLYPTRGVAAHTACQGAAMEDSPVDVRSEAATPVLCTGEASVHARYRMQFYRDLEEIFPLVDGEWFRRYPTSEPTGPHPNRATGSLRRRRLVVMRHTARPKLA
jgi:hypothetical protein